MNTVVFSHTNPKIIEHFSPVAAKMCLPEWYKNLYNRYQTQDGDTLSVKHCIPVLDYQTSGYIIKNSWETEIVSVGKNADNYEIGANCNSDTYVGFHQWKQCPFPKNNHKTDYCKILTGWTVSTPPGISCLFIDPFYFEKKNFELLPAIVDTDTYDRPVNFVIRPTSTDDINLAPNQPLVHVIPFRREKWNHKVVCKEQNSYLDYFMLRKGPARKLYKKLFHSKKSFN